MMKEYMYLVIHLIKIIPILELIFGRIGKDRFTYQYMKITQIMRQVLTVGLKYLEDGVEVKLKGHFQFLQEVNTVLLK